MADGKEVAYWGPDKDVDIVPAEKSNRVVAASNTIMGPVPGHGLPVDAHIVRDE